MGVLDPPIGRYVQTRLPYDDELAAYPARPQVPAGTVLYIGPIQPTDPLGDDEWLNTDDDFAPDLGQVIDFDNRYASINLELDHLALTKQLGDTRRLSRTATAGFDARSSIVPFPIWAAQPQVVTNATLYITYLDSIVDDWNAASWVVSTLGVASAAATRVELGLFRREQNGNLTTLATSGDVKASVLTGATAPYTVGMKNISDGTTVITPAISRGRRIAAGILVTGQLTPAQIAGANIGAIASVINNQPQSHQVTTGVGTSIPTSIPAADLLASQKLMWIGVTRVSG